MAVANLLLDRGADVNAKEKVMRSRGYMIFILHIYKFTNMIKTPDTNYILSYLFLLCIIEL